MATRQFTALLRRLVGGRNAVGSDRQLLERFVAEADEAAFAGLVDRHGQLVFHVCRSVLCQEQDAEDAFQATFLVLARLASSVRKRDSLASWLHGVALRTALKARRAMNTRRRHEQKAAVPSQQEPVSETALREVQTILHDEIARLPEKYRTPFVLCCLEGKSRAEAAQQLGWKDGTVSGRIAQARALLQERLARRGVALPDLAPASVPTAVRAAVAFAAGRISETVSPFAATLAQGVMQAMLVTKLKTIAATALMLVVVLAGGWLAYSAWRTNERSPWPINEMKQTDPDSQEAEQGPRFDAYGDPLPPGALARLGTVRFRGMSMIAYSSDGKIIVCNGGAANGICVVDARTGKELRSFELKPAGLLSQLLGPPVGRPALSPDGRMLAIAWSDPSTWNVPEKIQGAVYVWDTNTGKELKRMECAGIPGRPAFSPDGKMLLTMEKGILHVWDANFGMKGGGKELHDFKEFAGTVGQPIFSGEGKVLALDLLPRNSYLKMPTEPRTLLFLDTATWKQVRPALALQDFQAFNAGLHSFSPDGKLLVGDDVTGHLIFWDAATGKLIERVLADDQGTPSALASVSFSPDSKLLAVVVRDGRVTLWDAATRKVLHKIEGARYSAVFSPQPLDAEKRPVLATGSNGPALRFWDPITGKEIPINDAPLAPVQMTFWLPGDKVLAVYPAEKGYRLWDARSGKQLAKVATGDRYIWWAVASTDGQFLAVSNWRGQAGDDTARCND